jgi:hypothetical protein
MATKVEFRIYPTENEVIALFPNEIVNSCEDCASYMHIGQHSPADYISVIAHTKPATKEQYTALYNELVSIGYDDLEIVVNDLEKLDSKQIEEKEEILSKFQFKCENCAFKQECVNLADKVREVTSEWFNICDVLNDNVKNLKL